MRVLVFLREPELMFWVFFFPMLLAAVLGYAFRNEEVQPSRVGVLAGEGAAAVLALLEGTEGLTAELVEDIEASALHLRKGTLDVVVEPADPPRLRFNPGRPEAETARLRVLRAIETDGRAETARPRAELVPVSERGGRYIDYLFPGLLALNLMGTGLWAIGFSVANLRQRKVLKRLLVTPMRRSSFLLAFILARLVFMVLETCLLTAFGVWFLEVPFRTGVADFVALCLLSAVAFSGVGLMVTARVRTIQGASGILNLAVLPMWLLTGVFFSYERYPEIFHPLIRWIPLTPLNDALRAMMLDGAGLSDVPQEIAIVVLWGIASFLVALRFFRWE